MENLNKPHQKYLPHIDGLRAIAVMSVFLYHLRLPFLSGGYIGVDVFFVISGYLITGGIYKDLTKGSFSLQSFYPRRIRRILPAYFSMVAGVLLISIVLYAYKQLKIVALSALSSALYITNIRFELNHNYFGPNTQEDPLLNLWSLGVEEQFYFFIPVILLIIWKKKPALFNTALWVMLLISLVWSQLSMHAFDVRHAFYFPQLRAWEFLAGSILSVKGTSLLKDGWKSTVLCLIGLILIAVPGCVYTDETLFPGISALPVIVGSVLVIYYGVSAGIFGRVLRSAPFLFIGRISYSLYLWHWPVIVFWRYLKFNEIGPWDTIGILVTSFILATLSWKFVEMKFRFRMANKNYKYYLYTAIGCAVIGGFSAFLFLTNGGRHYFHQQANKLDRDDIAIRKWRGSKLWVGNLNTATDFSYESLIRDTTKILAVGDRKADSSFLVWGDSHAVSFLPGIDSATIAVGKGGYFINRNCGIAPEREKYYPFVTKWISEHKNIKQVYLIQRWSLRLVSTSNDNFLINLCKQLTGMGLKVTLFQNIPEYADNPTDYQAKVQILHFLGDRPIDPVTDTLNYRKLIDPYRQVFTDLAKMPNIRIISTDKEFYKNGFYHAADGRHRLLYQDTNHLSPDGSKYFFKAIGFDVFNF